METALTSPLSLLKKAWSLALSRPNILPFLILGALPQLLIFLTSLLIEYTSGSTDLFTNSGGWVITGFVVVGLIVIVIISLISAWYSALLYKVYQATATGTLEKLTAYVRPAKSATAHLLVTYMIVGFFTSLGFLLFIIPGIILAVRYMFAPMIATVEDRAIKPIDESKRLVKGRFWKLAGRCVVIIVCYNIPHSVLQSIHPLIGTAWAITSPIFGLYFFLVYNDFKRTAFIATA